MTKAVNFQFDAAGISGVTGVKLAGEFNSWVGEAMANSSGTLWTLAKNLAVGATYAYKFIVTDGSGDSWFYDQNGFRGKLVSDVENSYVAVPAPGFEQIYFIAAGPGDAVANTADETSIPSNLGGVGPVGSLVLPANSAVNDEVFRIKAYGYLKTKSSAPGDLWFRLKLGGVTVCTYHTQGLGDLPAGLTTVFFEVQGEIIVVDHVSGGVYGNFRVLIQTPAGPIIWGTFTTSVVSGINFAADAPVDFTAQWQTADPNNQVQPYFFSGELLTPPSA